MSTDFAWGGSDLRVEKHEKLSMDSMGTFVSSVPSGDVTQRGVVRGWKIITLHNTHIELNVMIGDGMFSVAKCFWVGCFLR